MSSFAPGCSSAARSSKFQALANRSLPLWRRGTLKCLPSLRALGGPAMASEFGEELAHAFEGFQQVEGGNAAAGSRKVPVFGGLAEHEDRAREAFDETAGYDAEHAEMPLGPRED